MLFFKLGYWDPLLTLSDSRCQRQMFLFMTPCFFFMRVDALSHMCIDVGPALSWVG